MKLQFRNPRQLENITSAQPIPDLVSGGEENDDPIPFDVETPEGLRQCATRVQPILACIQDALREGQPVPLVHDIKDAPPGHQLLVTQVTFCLVRTGSTGRTERIYRGNIDVEPPRKEEVKHCLSGGFNLLAFKRGKDASNGMKKY